MIIIQVITAGAIIAGWAWLIIRGVPSIIHGLAEVRANFNNDQYWSDDDYWDDELHRLLVEEEDPSETWKFLNEEEK
jgi:hypothetical protein